MNETERLTAEQLETMKEVYNQHALFTADPLNFMLTLIAAFIILAFIFFILDNHRLEKKCRRLQKRIDDIEGGNC